MDILTVMHYALTLVIILALIFQDSKIRELIRAHNEHTEVLGKTAEALNAKAEADETFGRELMKSLQFTEAIRKDLQEECSNYGMAISKMIIDVVNKELRHSGVTDKTLLKAGVQIDESALVRKDTKDVENS